MEYYKNLISKKSIILGIPCSLVALQYYLSTNKNIKLENIKLENINDTNYTDHNIDNKIREISDVVDEMCIEKFTETIHLLNINKKQNKLFIKGDGPTIDKLNELHKNLNDIVLIMQNHVKNIRKKKNIIGDQELKISNFPQHITINGKFTNVEYEKIYTNAELIKDQIYDNIEALKEEISWLHWFKDQDELDKIYLEIILNKDIQVSYVFESLGYNVKNLPTIEKQKKFLTKLENIIQSLLKYTSEINIIVGIIDYMVSNGLKTNITFFTKEGNTKLLDCNIFIKNNLNKMNHSIVEKIQEIESISNDILWLDFHKLNKVKFKYFQHKNSITNNISIDKLNDLDIKLLENKHNINIDYLSDFDYINPEDFFTLYLSNQIKSN
jgi:hypothetical protein